MPNYDYRDFAATSRFNRFPEYFLGINEWRRLCEDISYGSFNRLRLTGLQEKRNNPIRCPRIFVSHRQADTPLALPIAKMAAAQNFEYWIDVLDPSLQSLGGSGLSGDRLALLTAGIIEMALINCTHVMVVMTQNTKGTMWVPYEYGRITDIPSNWGRAAAWKHPQFPASDLPEYLLLGVVTENKMQISRWLGDEYNSWTPGRCGPVKWEGGTVEDLPE